tara:strand:+ start:194 stop:976 length:783 start_codon:yes stop_codon:yes gene_type:complete
MKKYLVIGNPIEHSLSPKLHNYWIKENNIKAIYEKKKISENDIEGIINEIKKEKISGINVTVPFKRSIIPFVDELTLAASSAKSINTIFKKNNKIIGDNTDIGGFEQSLKYINYSVKNKKIFILGAGGVTPSVIIGLKNLGASKITLSNRTKKKAEDLKKLFKDLNIINWGQIIDFDMIINTTSLGLKNTDEIKLNYSDIGSNKLFYDVIYNPKETNFLKKAKLSGNKVENGEMMFIFQAQLSFKIWHNILPKVTDNLLK